MSTVALLNIAPGVVPHRLETGCLIDGSHIPTDDFNARVIRLAYGLGREYTSQDEATLAIHDDPKLRALLPLISDEAEGRLAEWLNEEAEKAEEWLNSRIEDGYVFHVHEQSLFLTAEADMDGWA